MYCTALENMPPPWKNRKENKNKNRKENTRKM
jgi:hypothetical protein